MFSLGAAQMLPEFLVWGRRILILFSSFKEKATIATNLYIGILATSGLPGSIYRNV